MRTVPWTKIDLLIRKNADFRAFGVYCIRIVAQSKKPIPIKRIGGIDRSGQIYIGRSGLSNQSNRRTIANRLYEFQGPNHSGGQLYRKMKKVLRGKQFRNHHLEAEATILPNSRIKKAEAELLEKYFQTFGEWPPCNSQKA
jgi:hypothetical protein